MRLLVVDDDPAVREALALVLDLNGFEVTTAVDGRDAIRAMAVDSHDAVVLDVLMPGIDGLEVCRRLRSTGDRTPVLMLTARSEVSERVAGLEAGADDYQTKPFGTKELLARVNALLRRSNVYAGDGSADALVTGNLRVDFDQHLAYKAGKPLDLTPTEFNILAFLARSPGEIQASRAILQKVWGPAYRDEVHLLRVNVARLRRKIEDVASDPQFVLTHSRVGYSLAARTVSS